jgi:hypothetical protein
MPRLIDMELEVRHVTERGVLVSDGEKEVWLPLSQVEINKETETTVVTMPEWLAIEKELI